MLLDMGRPPRLKRVDLAAGEQRLPAYLALNPAGMVPTLIMDGEPWVESSALLLMLADRHPGADLLPPVGSARRQLAYQWTLLMANGLQPAFRFWFYPQEAAGDSAAVEAKAAERTSRARVTSVARVVGVACSVIMGGGPRGSSPRCSGGVRR
jgi:glutathione S-transferase